MSSLRHTTNSLDLLRSRPFIFSSPELQNLSSSTHDEWSPQWSLDEIDQDYFRRRRASGGTEERFWSYSGDGPSRLRNDSDQCDGQNVEMSDSKHTSASSTENSSDTHRNNGCPSSPVSMSYLPASAVSRLPPEVIQEIFWYLHPKDFNSARHSCRAWMLSSLDRSLLKTMLQRGAWWSGAHGELWAHSTDFISEEWLLSRHLARQCALSSGWTGNGVDKSSQDSVCALVQTAEIDFSELSHGYIGSAKPAPSLAFAVSICGQYLMVAEASMIYIYTLERGGMRLLTNVICPRKALAMSMDASGHRFAIAVLLEGRMGMICDLKFGPGQYEEAPDAVPGDYDESSTGYRTRTGSSLFTSRIYPLDSQSTSVSQNATHMAARPTFNTVNVRNSDMNSTLYETTNPEAHDENLINQTWNLHLHYMDRSRRCLRNHKHSIFCDYSSRRMPLENGPHTVYRHLCSEDDPPRSVAICPQRRCVAFGCSSGIELHWIDAQTGQDLQRWFPLSAPSDFLYFLNPRPGVDSTHKLRIISSVAHPQDREGIRVRFFPEASANILAWDYRTVDRERRWYPGSYTGSSTNPHARRQNASQEYTNSPFSPSSPLSLSSAIPSTDHYRAVPLSDGYHHLFTDPISSALYLGSDAPLGGGVKLLRKVRFIPPVTAVPRFFAPELLPPTAYAVGAGLETGARVAAAYGSAIVLYNVPADVLLASRADTGRSECGVASCRCHDSTRRRAEGRSSTGSSNARGSSASAAADAESCQCEGVCSSIGAGQPTWREWWDAASSTLLPGPQSPSFLSSSDSSPQSTSLPTPPQTPSGDLEQGGITLPPYPHPSTPNSAAGGSEESAEPLWPLALHGTLLGRVTNVVDLAVNDSPELTVWAISSNGKAESWGIPSAPKSAPADVDGEQRLFFGCGSRIGKHRSQNGANEGAATTSAVCCDGRVVDAAMLRVENVGIGVVEQPEWWDDDLYTDDFDPYENGFGVDVDDEDGKEDDYDDAASLRFEYPATAASGVHLHYGGDPDEQSLGQGSSVFDGTDTPSTRQA